MRELLASLLLWINANTALDYQGPLPGIERVPIDEIIELVNRRERSADAGEAAIDYMRQNLVAIYRHEEGTIYVRDDHDLWSVEGRATLVHELVHHIQFATGTHRRVPCRQALEADAYRIEHAYGRAHGLAPRTNDLAVLLFSSCETGQ